MLKKLKVFNKIIIRINKNSHKQIHSESIKTFEFLIRTEYFIILQKGNKKPLFSFSVFVSSRRRMTNYIFKNVFSFNEVTLFKVRSNFPIIRKLDTRNPEEIRN